MRASSHIAILACLALAACTEAHSARPAVAVVGGEAIAVEEYRTRYIDYLLKASVLDAPQYRKAFLDRLVMLKLMVRVALDEGLADTEAYRFEAEATRRKLLLDAYTHHTLYDTLQVTQPELEAMFVRVNTTLTARHLYARTREQAEALHARLQAGASFEALAREVFADPALAESGGSVGTFGFDEMDPAFEDAAFALALGEVSPPVQTAQGFSIIQLQDRMTKPLLTESEFATRKDKLQRYVTVRKRQAARTQHLHALKAELHPTLEGAAMDRLLAQVTGRAMMPDGEAQAAWLATPLVAFGPEDDRRVWTVAAFRDAAAFADPAQRAQVQTPTDLETFVTALVVREAMLERARAADLTVRPGFAEAYARAMETWVFEQAWAQQEARLQVPEADLRAYYDAHPEDHLIPQTVRVWEIVTDRKGDLVALQPELSSTPFETLARRHSLRPGADATGGDLGFVRAAQLGALADPVFAAFEGDILGPLEIAGRYALLKVGERRPARAAAFEEVRADIDKQLRFTRMDAHIRAYTDTLRTRYGVVVNDELLYRLPLMQHASS